MGDEGDSDHRNVNERYFILSQLPWFSQISNYYWTYRVIKPSTNIILKIVISGYWVIKHRQNAGCMCGCWQESSSLNNRGGLIWRNTKQKTKILFWVTVVPRDDYFKEVSIKNTIIALPTHYSFENPAVKSYFVNRHKLLFFRVNNINNALFSPEHQN